MNLQKIINKINIFFKKYKKTKRKSNIFLNNSQQPLFRNKRKSFKIKNFPFEKLKIFGNKTSHYYILILFLIFLTIVYIFFGPVFKIKSIEIIKQDNITNMQIAYKASDKYRGQSIIKIEKKEILKHLQDYQHNIRNVKTNIILPNTLKIIIDSYKGVFNTIINDKNFIITENGTLVPGNPSEELQNLTIKNQFEKNKFYDYKKTLDTEYIKKISSIIKSLEENIIDIKIKENTYFIVEREFHIETENNTTIIIDLNGEYKKQIEKLAIFNKDYLPINKTPLVYIDLRIKNKVFYCSNEKEYQCISNLKSIYSY